MLKKGALKASRSYTVWFQPWTTAATQSVMIWSALWLVDISFRPGNAEPSTYSHTQIFRLLPESVGSLMLESSFLIPTEIRHTLPCLRISEDLCSLSATSAAARQRCIQSTDLDQHVFLIMQSVVPSELPSFSLRSGQSSGSDMSASRRRTSTSDGFQCRRGLSILHW